MKYLISVFISLFLHSLACADTFPVKTFTKTIGPYNLKSASLGQIPVKAIKDGEFKIRFPEPIWVVAYRTEIVDPSGRPLAENYHCHSTFQTFLDNNRSRFHSDGRTFRGLFSDGYNTGLRLPAGFGVYYEKHESIDLIPMFNNRSTNIVEASMRLEVDYVPAGDLQKKIRPLYGTVQSVSHPHLYTVGPGIDRKDKEFQFSFDGTFRVIAVHIHPYGKRIELYNVTKKEMVWEAEATRSQEGQIIKMPLYNSDSGYGFNSQETYRLSVIYENPTKKEQDAMGGLFVLFSTDDDQAPVLNKPLNLPEADEHVH